MNRRKIAIAIITADVAENGIAGKAAIRAFVESRLSRSTFDQACAIGQAIYQRKRANEAGAVNGYWTKAA